MLAVLFQVYCMNGNSPGEEFKTTETNFSVSKGLYLAFKSLLNLLNLNAYN